MENDTVAPILIAILLHVSTNVSVLRYVIVINKYWYGMVLFCIFRDVNLSYIFVSLYSFYTAANVHSAIKQFLRIIHTSLAIEKFFM